MTLKMSLKRVKILTLFAERC